MDFILMRDRVIATKTGHSIRFEKGKPTFVPPIAYNEVIAAGAVPTEEIPDEKPNGAEPGDPGERQVMIVAAIEQLVLGGKRENFTAGGLPHTKALTKVLGWEVSNAERDAAWKALKSGD